MRINKPVIVYVGDDDRASDFMDRTGTYVLGAPTTEIAISQIIFSSPDAIIIDALPENMTMAEAIYKHLRTFQHIPTVVLSNLSAKWDTRGRKLSTVLNPTAPDQAIVDALRIPVRVARPIAS